MRAVMGARMPRGKLDARLYKGRGLAFGASPMSTAPCRLVRRQTKKLALTWHDARANRGVALRSEKRGL